MKKLLITLIAVFMLLFATHALSADLYVDPDCSGVETDYNEATGVCSGGSSRVVGDQSSLQTELDSVADAATLNVYFAKGKTLPLSAALLVKDGNITFDDNPNFGSGYPVIDGAWWGGSADDNGTYFGEVYDKSPNGSNDLYNYAITVCGDATTGGCTNEGTDSFNMYDLEVKRSFGTLLVVTGSGGLAAGELKRNYFHHTGGGAVYFQDVSVPWLVEGNTALVMYERYRVNGCEWAANMGCPNTWGYGLSIGRIGHTIRGNKVGKLYGGEGIGCAGNICEYNEVYDSGRSVGCDDPCFDGAPADSPSSGLLAYIDLWTTTDVDSLGRYNLLYNTKDSTYRYQTRNGRQWGAQCVKIADERDSGSNQGKIEWYGNVCIAGLYGVRISNCPLNTESCAGWDEIAEVRWYGNTNIDNAEAFMIGAPEGRYGAFYGRNNLTICSSGNEDLCDMVDSWYASPAEYDFASNHWSNAPEVSAMDGAGDIDTITGFPSSVDWLDLCGDLEGAYNRSCDGSGDVFTTADLYGTGNTLDARSAIGTIDGTDFDQLPGHSIVWGDTSHDDEEVGDASEWGDGIDSGAIQQSCVPDTPSITNPTDTETDLAVNETITSSAYSKDPSCSETHTGSDWEVCSDGNCQSVYASSYDDTTYKVSWTVSPSMATSTTYYFRVRHYNSAGDSAWSGTVSGTTGGSPVGGAGALYILQGTGTGEITIGTGAVGEGEITLE